jgi:membrane-associated phospholipid phosphatase
MPWRGAGNARVSRLMNPRNLRHWVAVSLAVAAAVVLSIRYVDRPLARVMATIKPVRHMLAGAPVGFPLLVILAVVVIVVALGHVIARKPLSRPLATGAMAGIALVGSVLVTEFGLKIIFGRTLPSAYLHGGDYGFHWFHDGNRFGSFPSGHTDQATAILSILWVSYPQWRWLYAALLIVLSLLLMIGEWHFLSDIIAGGYVGVIAGAITRSAWQALARRR